MTTVPAKRRVTIVGPCAAGKSTLALDLQRLGYEARIVGQEHSDIPDLWKRRHDGILVFLDADLPTIRSRRGADWPQDLFARQQKRLENARAAADVVVDTSGAPAHRTVGIVTAWLDRHTSRSGESASPKTVSSHCADGGMI